VANIYCGDVWFGGFDPTAGHEQAGRRPMLVVSPDGFNQGPLKLALVLPITTNLRPLPPRICFSPPEGSLTQASLALCEAIWPVSHDRLERRMGTVSADTLEVVQDRLRILLNLQNGPPLQSEKAGRFVGACA